MKKESKSNAHASHGWRRALESPKVFNLFQRITGAEAWKRRIINEYVKPVGNEKILDVGCGTGYILKILDENLKIDYVGCDINAEYINYAQKNNSGRGRFYCCSVDSLPVHESDFDVILAIAIFHHLEDETSSKLIQTVKQKLKKDGIFLLTEPVWTEKQSSIEKYLMSKDRGRNIRKEAEYLQLVKSVFSVLQSKLIFDSHNIPWTVNIITCK
ncbi:MAG: class I SAM-dependent methyltransferase [Bacteroidetes bacterium]|nr:MAG: class I SAM-dependent methyltransferase [Bacteroidota bacterium]